VYGLYDTDGLLRYVCQDREACLAYAELFNLPSIECSLLDIPEPNRVRVKGQRSLGTESQAKNSN